MNPDPTTAEFILKTIFNMAYSLFAQHSGNSSSAPPNSTGYNFSQSQNEAPHDNPDTDNTSSNTTLRCPDVWNYTSEPVDYFMAYGKYAMESDLCVAPACLVLQMVSVAAIIYIKKPTLQLFVSWITIQLAAYFIKRRYDAATDNDASNGLLFATCLIALIKLTALWMQDYINACMKSVTNLCVKTHGLGWHCVFTVGQALIALFLVVIYCMDQLYTLQGLLNYQPRTIGHILWFGYGAPDKHESSNSTLAFLSDDMGPAITSYWAIGVCAVVCGWRSFFTSDRYNVIPRQFSRVVTSIYALIGPNYSFADKALTSISMIAFMKMCKRLILAWGFNKPDQYQSTYAGTQHAMKCIRSRQGLTYVYVLLCLYTWWGSGNPTSVCFTGVANSDMDINRCETDEPLLDVRKLDNVLLCNRPSGIPSDVISLFSNVKDLFLRAQTHFQYQKGDIVEFNATTVSGNKHTFRLIQLECKDSCSVGGVNTWSDGLKWVMRNGTMCGNKWIEEYSRCTEIDADMLNLTANPMNIAGKTVDRYWILDLQALSRHNKNINLHPNTHTNLTNLLSGVAVQSCAVCILMNDTSTASDGNTPPYKTITRTLTLLQTSVV